MIRRYALLGGLALFFITIGVFTLKLSNRDKKILSQEVELNSTKDNLQICKTTSKTDTQSAINNYSFEELNKTIGELTSEDNKIMDTNITIFANDTIEWVF